ncbi:3-hydroxyanthranilate 3:4-dioxygenase-like isoform X2 [Leptotrombidium deliense]|uniref:3-hydroxyanthranilate 3:4-dioxygenase-like isoform X2 n=1 Tax=Leptotrombidium deliense TaxID=299467 RepID=A0A443SUM5_9ACAR|nr:3-hydroxyanthranilate 3:4-dioxygenase-like isoform X2 [Leptotrombidium deliense]
MSTEIIHFETWIECNKQDLQPPVCNKMLHNDQLKAFIVGGPNIRKDYHLNEGEEIVEKGVRKDVHIKEGQVFLLPGRIPHSPQRYADTFGLVIEREREKHEMDALRYYVDDTSQEILFERWFHCEDLGTQLAPIIREFFNSEEFKSGKPKGDSVNPTPPWSPNDEITVQNAFSLREWIEDRREKIIKNGFLPLFPGDYTSQVIVFGPGSHRVNYADCDTFLMQLVSLITVLSFTSFSSTKQ